MDVVNSPFPWEDIFIDPAHLRGSRNDLMRLYHNCLSAGTVPKLIHACGHDDFLYKINCDISSSFKNMGADIPYFESPGMHDWSYWDAAICRLLPLLLDNKKPVL